MRYDIKFRWDSEAEVWTATSEDVPGLVLESGSFDALLERVKMAVPELLKLNGHASSDFRLHYSADREDCVAVY